MDWIETWFGVSPDGGNGVTEWLFVLAGVAVVVAIVPPFRRAARPCRCRPRPGWKAPRLRPPRSRP